MPQTPQKSVMKVLVATRELQGQAPGDHSLAAEGELVTPIALDCGSPAPCACGRGFAGLASAERTTTAMVVERPQLDRHLLREAIRASLERCGPSFRSGDEESERLIERHLACIELVCAEFPVGTVVSRWGSKVFSRPRQLAA